MLQSLNFLLAGIVIGVLIAPDKGSNTRKKISDRIGGYFDEAQNTVKDAVENIDPQKPFFSGRMGEMLN